MRGARGKRPWDESEDRAEEGEEIDEEDDGDRDSGGSKAHRRCPLGGAPLTEARAKQILEAADIKVGPNSINCSQPLVVIHPGPLLVLGGAFELATLEALIFLVKAQQLE